MKLEDVTHMRIPAGKVQPKTWTLKLMFAALFDRTTAVLAVATFRIVASHTP
jgi:hypothetical protein